MPSSELYEGRPTSDPLQDWGNIAKYGVGSWIDAMYYERVGGQTTGDRVRKNGAGGPVIGGEGSNGQVRTTAQRDGTAVRSGTIAGIDPTMLLLFGALAVGAYVLMD